MLNWIKVNYTRLDSTKLDKFILDWIVGILILVVQNPNVFQCVAILL